MTIKKSDLLALIETLPEEFDREALECLGDQLEGSELSEAQWKLVDEAAARLDAGLGITSAELKDRIDRWATQ